MNAGMYTRIRNYSLLSLFIGLLAISAHAEQPPADILNSIHASYSAELNWQSYLLTVKITAPIDTDNSVRNNTTLLSRKEDELRQFFPSIFSLTLHNIRIDSQNILRDVMQNDAVSSLGIQHLVEKAELVKSAPARNLRAISLEYRLPLLPGLSSFLLTEHALTPLERLLSWQAPAEYTGLIIYAKEKVLRYGTDQMGSVVPCLFPRILDEDKRLIIDKNSVKYAAAVETGILEYRSALDAGTTAKVGKNPLVVTARALYGDSPTDLMISRSEADLLLYNKSTRDALANGKIVVIVDTASLTQKLVD